MSPTAKALYAQLAKALGVADVPADANGIVHLTVGDDGRVVLVPEDALHADADGAGRRAARRRSTAARCSG